MYSFAEYLFWFYDLDSSGVLYLNTQQLLELRDEYQKYLMDNNHSGRASNN